MPETMYLDAPSGLANYTKASPEILLGGGQDLSITTLGKTIINASSSRTVMAFERTDQASVINTYPFTLNPQVVLRNAKAVEAEYATMGAWHTYRWMIEPALWQISGYVGYLGMKILQNIVDIDGQDNIMWSFPAIFPHPRQVKIISTQVQVNAPYSAVYTILMRELPTVVRNYFSTQNLSNRPVNPFVSPSFDVTKGVASTKSWPISPSEKSIDLVVKDILSTTPLPTSENQNELYQDILSSNGLLNSSPTWASDETGPTNAQGTILAALTYHG